jgi:hypothetical protein
VVLNNCWIFAGGFSSTGYGDIGGQSAHRVIYENLVGKIASGLQIDHLCMVKACINPAHLEAVSQQENVQRWNKTRTHCKNGHEFTDENTYQPPKRPDRRYCKECQRQRNRVCQTSQ